MKKSSHSPAMVADGRLRFSVVTLADVERIHELSLRVLAETGILLHYPPARQLLADHGAVVDEARQVVRIPRRLVEQALASAPREVHVYSQADPRHDYRLCLDGPRYAAHHHRAELDRGRRLALSAAGRRGGRGQLDPRDPRDAQHPLRRLAERPGGSGQVGGGALPGAHVAPYRQALHVLGLQRRGDALAVAAERGRAGPRPPPAADGAFIGQQPVELRLGPVRGRDGLGRAGPPGLRQLVGGGGRDRAGDAGRQRRPDERRDPGRADDPATAPPRRTGGLRRASDGAGHEDRQPLDQHGRGGPDVGRLRRDRALLRSADRPRTASAPTPARPTRWPRWRSGRTVICR